MAETDASPFEHLCLLRKIRDRKRLIRREQGLILAAYQIVDLVEQILASLHPLVSF